MRKTTRKNIPVARLVEMVNKLNRESTCEPAVREGWNELLADVLLETGNYKGFGYLTAEQVPVDQAPGITGEPSAYAFPDNTRRQYFGPIVAVKVGA